GTLHGPRELTGERRLRGLREVAARRAAVDPDDLLAARVDAAGQDAALRGRLVAGGRGDAGGVDAETAERREQALAGVVAPHDSHGDGARVERAEVRDGVPRSARDELDALLVEDEDGCLARDARELPVEELVGDEVAEHDDAPARERVHDLAKALVGRRHDEVSRIHSTASSRSAATWSGSLRKRCGWCSSSPRP